MSAVNVLALVHGITPIREASSHSRQYEDFLARLFARSPAVKDRLLSTDHTQILGVEWGHELPLTGPDTPDQFLTRAESRLVECVSHIAVREDPSPDNHVLRPGSEFLSGLTRGITNQIKDELFLLGFTDIAYYCSPDGERAVRRRVYTQVLELLRPFKDAEQVRLHVVAHSLGMTVAFDFLFGLFAPTAHYGGNPPDFIRENQNVPGLEAAVEDYQFWRSAANMEHPEANPTSKRLLLGSKTSFGGQLALLVMRKQALVERLARRELLDPTVIGVPRNGRPRWKNFYDVDDVLGFPVRRLFDATGTIQEYQVDCGGPSKAHGGYWSHGGVLSEIASLIEGNLGN